jgi:hypothetical protein
MTHINQQLIHRGAMTSLPRAICRLSSESETDNLTQALLPRISPLRGTHHRGRLSRLEFPGLGASLSLVLSRENRHDCRYRQMDQ